MLFSIHNHFLSDLANCSLEEAKKFDGFGKQNVIAEAAGLVAEGKSACRLKTISMAISTCIKLQ
jgi:hypothetical protein